MDLFALCHDRNSSLFFFLKKSLSAEMDSRVAMLMTPLLLNLAPAPAWKAPNRWAFHQGSLSGRVFTFLITRLLPLCCLRSWKPRGRCFSSPSPHGGAFGEATLPSKPQFLTCKVGTAVPPSRPNGKKFYLLLSLPPMLSEFILKVYFLVNVSHWGFEHITSIKLRFFVSSNSEIPLSRH